MTPPSSGEHEPRDRTFWDLGLISLLAADTAFLATQLAGTYRDGTLIDAAFLLSGLLWAASALQGSNVAPMPTDPFSSPRMALTTIPALRVTYTSSDLRAAVETAQALIAFLVTHLLYLRFRKTRRLSDLLLVYGIGLLGAVNVFFVVSLALGGKPG